MCDCISGMVLNLNYQHFQYHRHPNRTELKEKERKKENGKYIGRICSAKKRVISHLINQFGYPKTINKKEALDFF